MPVCPLSLWPQVPAPQAGHAHPLPATEGGCLGDPAQQARKPLAGCPTGPWGANRPVWLQELGSGPGTSQHPLAASHGCCLFHEPSFLHPHPWGIPPRKRHLPEPPVGLLEPQNTLTGKGVPKINSGLACLPGLCPGLKVECTWGALSPAATPPSGQQRSCSPRTQCRRGMWDVLPSRAPTSTSHCPPGGPRPLVEPRDQTELLGLDHDPGFPALCGQPRQGPHRPSGQANATPPLFTRPQVPVRHLDLEGTGRPSQLTTQGRTHWAASPAQASPMPLPKAIPWRGPPAVSQAQAAGAILKLTQGRKGPSWRVGRGVRHPVSRPETQQGPVGDPCWAWVRSPLSCLLATSGANPAQSHQHKRQQRPPRLPPDPGSGQG